MPASPASAPPPPRRPLSLGKAIGFSGTLALLAALAVVGATELLLRWVGVGHSPKFYRVVTEQGERVVRENRWVTAPYFSTDLVRRPQLFRLPAEKAPQAFRIFVLGSSAAMGDPEPSFSFARVLEKLLSAAYPEIHFEVVNASVTAINSHVVRRIAADCAELEPDMFIVYEGHNEVIGPFGPGTIFTPFLRATWSVRAVDALKRTRLGQWVNEWTLRRRGTGREWGGMQMFLDRQVFANDPRLTLVRRRFAENLRSIAAAGRDAGAAVVLCTVLTNQRDFAPFLSAPRGDLTEEQRQAWDRAMARAASLLTEGDPAGAEAQYRAAEAIDPDHAELVFRLARLALGQGREAEARERFQRALDLDTLRFRADSALNRLVRETDGEQVVVADVEQVAARMSAGGIIGDELLLEHVHLTLGGAYVVGVELFHHVGRELVRRGRIERVVEDPLPIEEVRRRLAYTTYEQAMIIRELSSRFARPPFTGQADHAMRVQVWREKDAAASRLLARPGARDALMALYEVALEIDPDDWIVRRNYGMALVALDAPAEAIRQLERTRAMIDDDPAMLFALATAQQRLSRSEAAATFARLRQLEPRYPGLPPLSP